VDRVRPEDQPRADRGADRGALEHDRLVAGQRHGSRRAQAADPGADDHDPWHAASISSSRGLPCRIDSGGLHEILRGGVGRERRDRAARLRRALRGDEETLRDLAVPEFVADFSRRLVESGVLRGRDEALAFLSQTRQTWDDYPLWEPQKLIETDDKVVALIRRSARGRESGVELEAYVWNLWTFRDGKLVEVSCYDDAQAAALEAAGLPE
jgi:ketosteroid isomerase-like protein